MGLIRAPDVKHAEGAIFVFDANRVRTELAKATVAHVAAGCKPVRLWMQENGKRFFVTARGSDQLLVFDTQKLARIREITVGSAPCPSRRPEMARAYSSGTLTGGAKVWAGVFQSSTASGW